MIPHLPMRILHIINDLSMGGAEVALFRLLSQLPDSEFENRVIVLTDDQPVGNMVRQLGVTVDCLGYRRGIPDPRMVLRVRKLILDFKPDIVQTWMYHSDLAGSLAARWADGAIPVIWGIHHTIADRAALKKSTLAVAKLNALLSRSIPEKIICCSEASRETHYRLGYTGGKMVVIPNGFDVRQFQPDARAKVDVLHELGLPDDTLLVGLCARYDPLKDHSNFLQAAAILRQKVGTRLHFVLWGKDVDESNQVLAAQVESLGLNGLVHLLGLRLDGSRLFAALDVAALSSFSEAFPLALGEAMACGIPCAATDVGDAALIVGETGLIVPPRASELLAGALYDLLALLPDKRIALGLRARERVIQLFSLEKTCREYAGIYRNILASKNQL